jgi:hypothetical protein
LALPQRHTINGFSFVNQSTFVCCVSNDHLARADVVVLQVKLLRDLRLLA